MEEKSTATTDTPTSSSSSLPFQFNSFQQWELAFVYAFACTFNPHQEIAPSFYKLPEFTPRELETEIQKEQSDLVNQIICASIGNILNRKNPVESFKISLKELVTEKIKAFEIDLETNPLLKANFNSLTTDVKLYLLHSMIEWQLQDSLAVKSIMDYYNNNTTKNERNPIISYPIGVDSKKRNYWQFGESCWIWREKPHSKPGYEWETVCKAREDLDELVNTLSSSVRAEKALIKVIQEEIYEIADKEERKRQRKERAELRKLLPPPPVNITATTLRSRGSRSTRVRYNYDDEVYDFEKDEEEQQEEEKDDDDDSFEEEEKPKSPTRSSRRVVAAAKKPTRMSSRLNRSSTLDNLAGDTDNMMIDSQKLLIQEEQDMDTTPSNQVTDMDTRSPSASNMDTTPSSDSMQTSRSQSVMMDISSRPDSIMEL